MHKKSGSIKTVYEQVQVTKPEKRANVASNNEVQHSHEDESETHLIIGSKMGGRSVAVEIDNYSCAIKDSSVRDSALVGRNNQPKDLTIQRINLGTLNAAGKRTTHPQNRSNQNYSEMSGATNIIQRGKVAGTTSIEGKQSSETRQARMTNGEPTAQPQMTINYVHREQFGDNHSKHEADQRIAINRKNRSKG